MSKADKMFEKLGYKKKTDNSKEVIYTSDEILMGDRCIHQFLFAKVSKIVFSYGQELSMTMGFGIKELQAINEKVKELGWQE